MDYSKNDQDLSVIALAQAPDIPLAEIVEGPNGHLIAVAQNLRTNGVSVEDVVDRLRCDALTPSQLLRILEEVGYSKEEKRIGVKHFSKGCAHEGGGDIGTLPRYPSTRSDVNATDRDIRELANEAWRTIQRANNPPQFFNFGGRAVQIKASDSYQPDLEIMSDPKNTKKVLHLLGEVGKWQKTITRGDIPFLPKDVASHLVQTPHPPLPALRRLVRMPIFDSEGRLLVRPGYHEESRIFIAPKSLRVPRVSHVPMQDEIEKAKGLIVDELLVDFPFVNEADLVNAVGLLLTPFCRELIIGPTPLHLITKLIAGSGGTKLAHCLVVPSEGKVPVTQTLPENGSEIQRTLTAVLMTSPNVVIFDNITSGTVLDSPHLNSALTAPGWQGRQMGTSSAPEIPITNTWVATGNSVRASEEMARRIVPIRLDPKMENPFLRTGFRHDLPSWALEHRGELVWAALTLIQAWVAEGKPDGSLTWGQYESWAGVLSGILEVVGLPGLMGDWHDWNGSRPSVEKDLREAVIPWWDEFGAKEVRAADLLPVVGVPLGIDPGGERSSMTKLGTRLRSLLGRQIDGLEIVGRETSGSMLWRLKVIDNDGC